MPNWTEVQKKINAAAAELPIDKVRRGYLSRLHKKSGRNIIAYYSGFLQRTPSPLQSSIFDGDINALMNAVKGLDFSQGLDLILHTPGGQVTVTETFVDYLHGVFEDDIRCIVPQLALSGGTMIACSCKEIIMGKQSSIGPIDPQINGLAAHGIIEEYNFAKKEMAENPSCIPIWQVIYQKLPPSLIRECQYAMELSAELVTKWLMEYMFKDSVNRGKKAAAVVRELNDHSKTKTHGRHISVSKAKKIGLTVSELENDNEFQDLVLSVHHAYMETFYKTPACKIVENHNGTAMTINIAQKK